MEKKIYPPVQVIIAISVMYLLRYLFTSFNYSFSGKDIVFSLLVIISVCIGLSAVYSFKKHNTTVNPTKPEATSVIVNTGIYAFSRNPMYLAMVLFLIGVSILCANFLAFFMIPLFMWFITKYQIKPEEEALTLIFKKDYEEYITKVRRWI